MGEGFNVNIGEVRTHAQTVGSIADQVRSTGSSAQDSVSGGAFGQIAEFFASAITGAASEIREGINHAGGTVNQVQDGLSQAADGYQSTEERHVQTFLVKDSGAKTNG